MTTPSEMYSSGTPSRPNTQCHILINDVNEVIVTVPYIAFEEPYTTTLRRTDIIEGITGIMHKAWIRSSGEIQSGILVTDPDTEHAKVLSTIKLAENNGDIMPGTSLAAINEIINGRFDGTVDGERVMPEELSIKSILAGLDGS